MTIVDLRGEGRQIFVKFCWRHFWTAPKSSQVSWYLLLKRLFRIGWKADVEVHTTLFVYKMKQILLSKNDFHLVMYNICTSYTY
jgi:hypothetical protein